jgi:hypothetical protein
MSRFDVPDCYEADREFERMDLAYTAKIMRRPRCECCNEPLTTDNFLDLSDFGLNGVVCEKCVDRNMRPVADLDDDYE